MGYSFLHETSNLCSGTVEKGARTARSRAALQRCLRDAPLPDPPGERPRRVSSEDSPKPRMRLANGQERHPRLQREGPRRPHPWLLSPEASTRRLRPEERRGLAGRCSTALRGSSGASRAFGLWRWPPRSPSRRDSPTERVSGETIRATLSRLLGVRWMRAKRWITSPDPLYERKKEGATD